MTRLNKNLINRTTEVLNKMEMPLLWQGMVTVKLEMSSIRRWCREGGKRQTHNSCHLSQVLTVWPRLVLNSWVQKILSPQSLEQPELSAHATLSISLNNSDKKYKKWTTQGTEGKRTFKWQTLEKPSKPEGDLTALAVKSRWAFEMLWILPTGLWGAFVIKAHWESPVLIY